MNRELLRISNKHDFKEQWRFDSVVFGVGRSGETLPYEEVIENSKKLFPVLLVLCFERLVNTTLDDFLDTHYEEVNYLDTIFYTYQSLELFRSTPYADILDDCVTNCRKSLDIITHTPIRIASHVPGKPEVDEIDAWNDIVTSMAISLDMLRSKKLFSTDLQPDLYAKNLATIITSMNEGTFQYTKNTSDSRLNQLYSLLSDATADEYSDSISNLVRLRPELIEYIDLLTSHLSTMKVGDFLLRRCNPDTPFDDAVNDFFYIALHLTQTTEHFLSDISQDSQDYKNLIEAQKATYDSVYDIVEMAVTHNADDYRKLLANLRHFSALLHQL